MEEGSPVITGATGHVGRATINALVRRGITPTALVRGTEQLEGCATISDWLVSGRAVAAIERAATVVHLAGTLNPADRDYERANILPTQRVASAVSPVRTRSPTKYAMGALKHSLHSCFFCYHRRTTTLEEEVAFFNRRLGASRTLLQLLSLRRQYERSFAFVIRCLPILVRLHLRTARDNRLARAA
jgi:NAD(P)-dependent dehydrogenase (short-subunit alcohol dehydrogenase family)